MKKSQATLYLFIASGVFMVSGYLINVWLGRYLGPSLYGVYGVLSSLLTALNIMQLSGVPQAVSKFVAESSERADAVLKTALKLQSGLMLGIAVVLFAIAPFASHVFHYPQMSTYIRLATLIIPFYGLYTIYIGYYNGRHLFGRQASTNIAYSLAKLIFVVVLVKFFSLTGVIIGFIIAPIVALVVGFHWPKTNLKFSPYKLSAFALPLVIFAALANIQLSIDLFTVKALIAAPAAAGYYTAAQNIALIPLIGMSAIGQVLFPNVSRLLSLKQRSEAIASAGQSLRLLLVLLLPLIALIIGTAPGLIHLLYGASYAPAVGVLRLLILGYIGLTLFAFFANILNAAGRTKTAALIALLGVVGSLISCLILVPLLGISGAATGTLIGSIIVMIGSIIYAHRIIPYQIGVLSIARILIAAGVISLLGWVVPLSAFFLPLWWIVLGALYLGILLLTRELSVEETRELVTSILKPKAQKGLS